LPNPNCWDDRIQAIATDPPIGITEEENPNYSERSAKEAERNEKYVVRFVDCIQMMLQCVRCWIKSLHVLQQVVGTNGVQMLDTFHSSCLCDKFFTSEGTVTSKCLKNLAGATELHLTVSWQLGLIRYIGVNIFVREF
jgi:hypothetical protein